MSLVEYAESELRRAGMFDKDSDYDGELGPCILETVKTFSKYGHSGGSAYTVIHIINRLLQFKPLTALTSHPSEWIKIHDEIAEGFGGSEGVWQSRRRSDAFSRDGGQTWYYLDGDEDAED